MVRLVDSDVICLDSIETFMQRMNAPIPRNAEEKLVLTQMARDQLYSDIANRLPRIAAYLLEDANLDEDDKAKGLIRAIENHCMDAAFVNIVMQRLNAEGFIDDRHIVGALFVTVADRYYTKNAPTSKMKPDEEKAYNEKLAADIQHLKNASVELLRDIIEDVSRLCPGLSDVAQLAVAAAISVNNENTIKELMNFDGEITANIFDIYKDPEHIIKAALLLKKADYPKLTATQKSFVDSLTNFVFAKLNMLDMTACYRFLVATYKDYNPNTGSYLICVTDVSKSTYPNLHEVVKQFKS